MDTQEIEFIEKELDKIVLPEDSLLYQVKIARKQRTFWEWWMDLTYFSFKKRKRQRLEARLKHLIAYNKRQPFYGIAKFENEICKRCKSSICNYEFHLSP